MASFRVTMMRTVHRRTLLAVSVITGGLLIAAIILIWYWLYRDTTIYAAGFTEQKFSQLKEGMTDEEVFTLLGPPLSTESRVIEEVLIYNGASAENGRAAKVKPVTAKIVLGSDGRVSEIAYDSTGGARPGMSKGEILEVLGAPTRIERSSATSLSYSRPGGEVIFRGRVIEIGPDGRVHRLIRYEFHD
jgi:outer membrane protein assembly factor BamE (lipoprotein component of BamABCDE complex)